MVLRIPGHRWGRQGEGWSPLGILYYNRVLAFLILFVSRRPFLLGQELKQGHVRRSVRSPQRLLQSMDTVEISGVKLTNAAGFLIGGVVIRFGD